MKTKGLTLIELLTVVIIIGILATVTYPQFQNFIIRAKLKEIYTTAELIKAGERYYYFKQNQYRTFANAAYETNPDVEDTLHITIPKGGGAFCTYAFVEPAIGVRPYVEAYAKDQAASGWLYRAYVPWAGSTVNSTKKGTHPYSRYITADQTN